MITLIACPICDSKHINQFHEFGSAPSVRHEIMRGVFVDAAIITRYFLCNNCHVIFQNPRMSDEDLNKFYKEGYYRKLLNLTDEEKDSDEMHRAEYDANIIREKLGEIESHVDIGASRGFLLEKVGAKIQVGVESDIHNIIVSGIEVYSHMREITRKSFDLVTAIHTLEHVSKPVAFLKDMISLVSKNGHIVIEVPTWKSPGGPLRLPHLYHFETDVMRLLCKRVGLVVKHVFFTPHLLVICKVDHH